MGKTGLCECGHLQTPPPPPLLVVHIFWTSNTHAVSGLLMLPASTAVDSAAFGSSFHIHFIIFNCVVKTALCKGLLYDEMQSPRPDPWKMACFTVLSVICR